MSPQSAALRHMGPTWSMDQASGSTPARLTRPYVGLIPDSPHSEAGMRMEPPVSEPRAPGQMPAGTAAPEPDEDPPQILWVATAQGFHGEPECWFQPAGAEADACMCGLA